MNHGLGHIQDLYPTIQTYELIGNNIKITTNGDYETGLPNTTFRILEEGNKLHYLIDGQLGKLHWSGADMIFPGTRREVCIFYSRPITRFQC